MDTGKLTAFERLPRKPQWVDPSNEREKWTNLTGKSFPDPRHFPKDGPNVVTERKEEYRQLYKNQIGRLSEEKEYKKKTIGKIQPDRTNR